MGVGLQASGISLLGWIQQKWPNLIEGGRINDYCNFVITFAAITAAVMIFSYSALDNTRMGVSNRTIMRYRFGSKMVPVCFVINLLRLPTMKIFFYMNLKDVLCMELMWSSISQIIIITFVILSSNTEWVIKRIVKKEAEQYKKLFELQDNNLKQVTPWENPHIQRAMQSNELFSDKANILDAVFMIPFNTIRSTPKTTKLKKVLEVDMNILYIFYYQNAFGAFSVFRKNQDERQRLYTLLYAEIEKIIQEAGKYNQSENKGEKPEIEYKASLAISAILNAALMSRVSEAEAFCFYVLNNICATLDARMQKQQVIHYFLMLELMHTIDDGKVPMKYLNQLSHVLKHDDGKWLNVFCYSYWNIIVKNCTVDSKANEIHFWNAVSTLQKKRQASLLMTYIVQMEGSR